MINNDQQKPQKTFYYWLDPLRALAAILVLLVHARSVMFVKYIDLIPESQNILTVLFYTICNLGAFSVCLFYILSGFLVGGKSIEKSINGRITPFRFFSDRFFRIGVPLTGALILICIVNCLLGIRIEWDQLLLQYCGLQGILALDYGGVFWTLPYEIWFYAIILSFIIFIRKSKHLLIGALIFILSLLVFCNLRPHFYMIFACGIVCYILKNYKFNSHIKIFLWIILIISFVFYFFINLHYLVKLIGIEDIAKHLQIPSQIILFTIISLILSQYVLKTPTSICGVLINTGSKKIASFSYSLFLTHYQVLRIWHAYVEPFNAINLQSILYFIAICLISFLLAYIFHVVFEKNTAKIQRYIENLYVRNC